MSEIFYAARFHDAGPGEWCVRSTRVRCWQFGPIGRMTASLYAHILNDPDRYPELNEYGLDSMRFQENWQYKHKSDVPPVKIQENLMNTINTIVSKDNDKS